MRGGEIFIPKLPTIKIEDIIKAINNKAKIKIIGIRPGEKIHETLGGKDESRNILEFKRHYIIAPTFEEGNLKNYFIDPLTKEKGKIVQEDFEYDSSNKLNRLSISDIKKILTTTDE